VLFPSHPILPELGEIEAALYRHPGIKEAAVVAFPDEENIPINAFASARNGSKLSIIELKTLCSENLPLYMTSSARSSRCRKLRRTRSIIKNSKV
jgi:acyl-coenzyme A synthetase/AMP-(fatty) acid ligase